MVVGSAVALEAVRRQHALLISGARAIADLSDQKHTQGGWALW